MPYRMRIYAESNLAYRDDKIQGAGETEDRTPDDICHMSSCSCQIDAQYSTESPSSYTPVGTLLPKQTCDHHYPDHESK